MASEWRALPRNENGEVLPFGMPYGDFAKLVDEFLRAGAALGEVEVEWLPDSEPPSAVEPR